MQISGTSISISGSERLISTAVLRGVAVALALSLWNAGAADWPQWGGRNERNFVSVETGLPASFQPDRTEVVNGVCYAFDPRFTPGTNHTPGLLKKVWWFDCNPPQNKVRDGHPLPYGKKGEGPSEIIATPVAVDGRVYVAVGQDSNHGPGKGCFSCIDATKKGDVTETARIWQNLEVGRSFSIAAVSKDKLVFIADYAGILRCLDADTGQENWSHHLKGNVFGSPLCADGKVYIGTASGRLTVVSATREKKILQEVRFDGPHYATPVAANGVLYIATQRRLYAFRNRDGLERREPSVEPASLGAESLKAELSAP